MFRKQIKRLEQVAKESKTIMETIVKQNQDINDLMKEHMGEEIAEEVMNEIIQKEIADTLARRIREAFDG